MRPTRNLLTGAATGLAVVVVALIAPASPTTPLAADVAPLAPHDLAELVRANADRVVVLGCTVGNASGTAVALGAGRLVTNAHVVEQARLVNVSPDGGGAAVAPARSVPGVDLALLPTDDRRAGLALAPDDPVPGMPVVLAGYPLGGFDLRVVEAHVAGYAPDPFAAPGADAPKVLRLDRPAVPGMSGGPVLDRAGRVVGILFAAVRGEPTSYALPVSGLRSFLARDDLAPVPRC